MANQCHGITYNANELTRRLPFHPRQLLYCPGFHLPSTSNIYAYTTLFAREQVKSMAHRAAEAVKNTLWMNTKNTPTKNTSNNPSHLSTRA
ncbi:hypothetical protein NC652_008404 [Populus alba x Populus x berolinensis]|nr:hypothetical protein NC652_008404 [Populus alba x Populus x berolinensis]